MNFPATSRRPQVLLLKGEASHSLDAMEQNLMKEVIVLCLQTFSVLSQCDGAIFTLDQKFQS